MHCLKAREHRQGIELVEDSVQQGLRAELGEVRRVRGEMAVLRDTVEAQLSKNAAVRKKVRTDIVEKREVKEPKFHSSILRVLGRLSVKGR